MDKPFRTYLFKLAFLVSQASLKCLILRQEHLKALLVAILNGLHLDGQVLHCLVQVLDHLGELSVL